MSSEHKIEQGECLSSVAFECGFFWQTLWNHPANSQLKKQRINPNLLKHGDMVHVPDLKPKQESRATDHAYRFRVHGTPVKLCLRIMATPSSDQTNRDSGNGGTQSQAGQSSSKSAKVQPCAEMQYALNVAGVTLEGKTGDDGMIECNVPANAKTGELVLDPGTPNEFVIPLKIGSLQPVEEVAGAQARLNNLGFYCGTVDGLLGPRTAKALKSFQNDRGVKTTGSIDEPTRNKLRQDHDVR